MLAAASWMRREPSTTDVSALCAFKAFLDVEWYMLEHLKCWIEVKGDRLMVGSQIQHWQICMFSRSTTYYRLVNLFRNGERVIEISPGTAINRLHPRDT